MFKKNDPLVDSVKAVMEQNARARQIEAAVNEEFGVTSKNALPHEVWARYDRRLAEAKKCAMDEKVDPSQYSEKQKRLAHLGNRTGHGGDPKKIDEPDLKAVRKVKHIEEEEQKKDKDKGKSSDEINDIIKGKIEEKLSKSMSAGDVISDFVHSKNPKFKGKSTKQRQKMALGAYYGMHPEKSKKEISEAMTYKAIRKISEQAVLEEIRSNLEEQLVYVYENYSDADFAAYVDSLTEEQLVILGLDEGRLLKGIVKGAEKEAEKGIEKGIEKGATKEVEKGAEKEGSKILTPGKIAGATALGGTLGLVAGGYLNNGKGGKGRGGAGSTKGDYPGGPKDSEKKWGFHDKNIQALKGTAPKKMTSGDLVNRSLGGVYENAQIKESFEQFLRNRFLKG